MNDQKYVESTNNIEPLFMPNAVINFFLSFIPGCGQMYQGLLVRGGILMTIFAAFITLTIVFTHFGNFLTEILVYLSITGILITYSFCFFDSIRTCRLIRAGIRLKDYFDVMENPISLPTLKNAGQGHMIIGILMVVVGSLSLGSMLINRYVPQDILDIYVRPAMEFLLPFIFMVVGIVLLIKGHKAKRNSA